MGSLYLFYNAATRGGREGRKGVGRDVKGKRGMGRGESREMGRRA